MSEKTRRVLMSVFGVALSGVAVGFFSYSEMGFDPFQCFAHGLWSLSSLDYGTFYAVLNGVLLIFMLIFNRHLIGIGTLINLFLLGYISEGSEFVLQALFPQKSLPLQVVLLIIGIVVMCLASAVYFTGDLGVSTYDAVAITISQKEHRVPFRIVRILTDLVCVLIGWRLGAAVGVGTIVTAFFMGPLIDVFKKTVAEPMRYGKGGSGK